MMRFKTILIYLGYFFCYIIFLKGNSSTCAQMPKQPPFDSLRKVLCNQKDTAYALTLSRLVVAYAQYGEVEQCRQRRTECEKALKPNFPKPVLFRCYLNCGIGTRNISNSDTALTYYAKALKYASPKLETLELAEVYALQGQSIHDLRQHKESFPYLFKALVIFDKYKSYENAASLCLRIGYYYQLNALNHAEALKYLHKSIEYAGKAKPSAKLNYKLMEVYSLLASVYLQNNKKADALKYIELAEVKAKDSNDNYTISRIGINKVEILQSMDNFVSAKLAAIYALKAAYKCNYIEEITRANLVLANTYQALNELDSALIYYKGVIRSGKQLPRNYEVGIAYHAMANTYKKMQNLKLARTYNDSAYILFQIDPFWQYQKQVAALNASLDSIAGNFKGAYLWRKQEEYYKDSLKNEQIVKDFEKVTESLTLAQEQAETQAQLATQKSIKKAAENNRNWLHFSIAFIIVSIVITCAIYLNRIQIPEQYASFLFFIGVLFFFETILELIGRGLTAINKDTPIYILITNTIMSAFLSPLFHYLKAWFIKSAIKAR